MFKVSFKTLIPNEVKNWILEKKYEEPLLEAQKRLGWKLNNIEAFKSNGTIINVEYDEFGQMIGNCIIGISEENSLSAKENFANIFSDTARKGQKFKILSIEEKQD